MALKRARGLVNYWESRERGTPSPEDLADMIQMGLTCGRKTAEAAARAALDGRA
jgi:hypothetical protein